MNYEGRIYRPPSEAYSMLIQLTLGCSHNRCAFCAMYNDKKFRVRPVEDVLADVNEAVAAYPEARRAFICDGDALAAGFEPFEAVCLRLNERLPRLQRIAAYINARDILNLTDGQLVRLRSLKFSLGYLGLESGSAKVLEIINKGATPRDMIASVEKGRQFDIKTSVIGLLGIGGAELTEDHQAGTVETLNAMQPPLLAFLTTIVLPGTALGAWTKQGKFTPLTDRQVMREIRGIVGGLELNSTVFRVNHVSNLLPLKGRLPKDKPVLLQQIDQAIPRADDEINCVWSAEEGMSL